MVHVILVEPSGYGWTVRSEQIAGEVTFASGRQAEDAAKQLGATLADGTPPAAAALREGGWAGMLRS